jgi:hypothetical protein
MGICTSQKKNASGKFKFFCGGLKQEINQTFKNIKITSCFG